MTLDSDGGPAFPVVYSGAEGDTHVIEGMSLRDWFAGQALAGRYAAGAMPVEGPAMRNEARHLYRLADAMMEARDE